MPSKRSTRFVVKPFVKRLAKRLGKRFAMKHFTLTRPAAIGIIVVCIAGTAILIVARSSEPTSAASVALTPEVAVAAPVTEVAPVAKVQQPSTRAAQPAAAQTTDTIAGEELATIEGCLIQDDEQFHLKNTSGEDAPKGRSWKSGFLHRSAKTIAVLDETHRLNLAGHVGERVTVTGLLDDHELQATSVRPVAESCR